MKYNLKEPCKECPFRKNSAPGWIGSWESPEELANYTLHSEKVFPCHQTMTNAQEQDVPEAEQSVCQGALLFLRKNFKMPRDPKQSKAMLKATNDKDRGSILSYKELIEHHSKNK